MQWKLPSILIAAAIASGPMPMGHAPAPGDGFAAGMSAAMARMDAGMSVADSGDIDRDFAAMMIPHHQGAIDMALLELRYGKNTILRRLAQEIIVTQQQEIEVMQRTLADASRAATPSR